MLAPTHQESAANRDSEALEEELLKRHELLITLPVFNEGDRLEQSVERLLSALTRSRVGFALVLVEDGSSDGSADLARKLSEKYPSTYFFHHEARLGRGEAIRRCWKRLDADIYMFMDTDLSADLMALPQLLQRIQDGGDIATGSRYCPGARVSRPPLRYLTSRLYNALVRMMFHDGIQDHQCGFKAFSARAVRELLPQTEDHTWFWDTEVLVLARLLGYNVAEIPVVWTEMKAKRTPIGRLLNDIFIHGTGLLRLWDRISTLEGHVAQRSLK